MCWGGGDVGTEAGRKGQTALEEKDVEGGRER